MGRIFQPSLVVLAGVLSMAVHAAGIDDLPDPTRPRDAGATNGAPTGVQSILISPRRKVAVVQGRSVTIGDRVGDAEVVDIRPYEVILRRAGRETSLRLVPRLGKTDKEGGE